MAKKKFKFGEKEKPVATKLTKKRSTSKKPTIRDSRLDKIMPLVTDVLTKLLNSSGMMRYRSDFVEKIKKIMD